MAIANEPLSVLEAQLYDEGKALSSALPAGLGESLVGATIAGEGALAAAMRLKFFGELDLFAGLPHPETSGGCDSSWNINGQSALEPLPQSSPSGAGMSERMDGTPKTRASLTDTLRQPGRIERPRSLSGACSSGV